jgi:hypothetical protein
LLNLITYEIQDAAILEKSFEAIADQENLIIIVDEAEKKEILHLAMKALSLDMNCSFSFQNLFKITTFNNEFYIAQCLLEYNVPADKSRTTTHHAHRYQVIGIANLKKDPGELYLRPETKIDKFLGSFLVKDVDFDSHQEFSDKYYLVAKNEDAARRVFDSSLLNAIAKHDNLTIKVIDRIFCLTFNEEFKVNHTEIAADILNKL